MESLNDGKLSWEAPDGGQTAPSPTPIPTRTGPTSPAAARPSSTTASSTGSAASPPSRARRWKRIWRSRATSCWCSTPPPTRQNTDFFCRLVDQAPDSEQVPGMPSKGLILTRGWLKASHACTKSEELSKPVPAVLPARRAQAHRAGQDLQVRDRGLADVQRVQEGAPHPHRRGLRRFAGARLRRSLLRHQGRHATPTTTTRTMRRTSSCRLYPGSPT